MAAFLARPATAPPGHNYQITNVGNTNMKVVVRMRPESEAEIRSNYQGVVKVLDEHVLVFDPTPDIISTFQEPTSNLRRRPILSKKHKDLRFAFDRVFDETATQVDVFENTTKSIIDGVLDGINCSVFAYGATGAGKTYTMLGNLENPGVMFLTMMELYRRINAIRDERMCEVVVSYCEVYNETIRDLLAPSSGSLDLREDAQKGVVINKLTRHRPQTANEILSMLEIGNRNRTQHPTDANATSSRSHAVFQVFVHQKARTSGLSTQVMCAKMSLIDLAGSERATVTTNRGARLREGANINKSLLALGNCINALADNKGKLVHVPYRNSKLTRLLKDSLGGNCRTVMIANVSPSGLSYEDTYNTLKYADRAKQIRTKLVRNILTVDFHVTKYRTIVQDLQKEIAELKSKLERKTPKQRAFDPAEATRLQGLLQSVYGERSRLRKHMADLDASERETLLRIYRKERDLQRIDALTGNEVKKAKVNSRLETLRHHMTEIQRQKQTVHEYLYSNNESIGRIQAEINTSCNNSSASPALRQLVEAVTEAKKLEAESAHQWKQTKHLLKYIKNQEKDVGRNERILVLSLQLVRRQHAMLRASNALAPSLQETYDTLVSLAEGDKGVAWADQSVESLHDLSVAESQQALFESFLVHASPRGRNVNPYGTNSPSIAASLGILTSTTASSQVTVSSSGTSTNTVVRDSKAVHPLFAKVDAPIAPSPLSQSVQSRWQPKGTPVRIPNKPRKPTPTDDSSSSNGSTYNTRFRTILNTGDTNPAMSTLKRSKSDSSSGSSSQKDAQPYTLPRWQSNAKQGGALQPSGSSTMGGSLPHLARPTQSVGANSVDFAPKLHPPTTPLSQKRSATAFNAFEDNFVSPRVAFKPVSSQMKHSPSLQNLSDHALQPTQALGFPTALLCKPIPSPAPTLTSSHTSISHQPHTSISHQPHRERSGFVPISHAGVNHVGPAVSDPRPGPPHVPLGIGNGNYEDSSGNGRTSHMGYPSTAFTPSSMQGSSAFNPVPQRMIMSPAVHNPAQPYHSHYQDVVLRRDEVGRGLSHDSRRQDSAEQRRRLSAEFTASTGFHDPRGRVLAENHHRKQYAVEAMPSPRRCSADASWLAKQNVVEVMPSPRRGSADASRMQHTVQTIPSPRRCSADTSHDHRRQYSADVVQNTSMYSPSRRVSADIVYEFRRQQSAEQYPVSCSPWRKESADALYPHRKRHPTEIDPRSMNFNPDGRGSLESELNLTYTIDSDRGSVQSAPGVTTTSKHPMSMFNVASTNPLAPLHVNSPKPLEERHRTAFTGTEQKKLPSYLQMTKSASSKRVPRVHDKENQPASSNGKSVSKSKHKQHVRSMRSASAKASSHTAHFIW